MDNGGFTTRDIGQLTLSPSAPLESARKVIAAKFMADTSRTIHHQNGTFYLWTGTHYYEAAPEEMRQQLYAFLDGAVRWKGDRLVSFEPDKAKVANIMEAVAAEAQLPHTVRPPTWMHAGATPPASELIVCTNGLLHLGTRKMQPHSPDLFTLNALSFGYRPDAPQPSAWLEFLDTLWPDDPAAIQVLQEMFGLLLTGETRHQKAFLIVGPKRSGKGTIARVLTQLLGQANVCGPTLSSLAQNFGLAPLIGKRLAVISDARLGGKADQQVIVERILAITGEDSLTVDRKFRDGWTGRLETRFLILSNELPRLTDASGALASRFVVLMLKNSFFGREDHSLTDRLTREMPGILRWALDGWNSLSARGFFVPPKSALSAQEELEDLGSPIGAFLRDRCRIEPGAACSAAHLFQAWGDWCRDQGRDHAGNAQSFGRDLRAAVPGLTTMQPRGDDGLRLRYYEGVGLA